MTSDSAGGAEVVSVAGRNNRYNNMQIDGAVNNDVFGLAATGTPGGQTSTQPISLDAIQEIQLLVSPYDVRQGGFSGGGINAITKSGTNAFHGGAYYVGRNQNLIGADPGARDDRPTRARPTPTVGKFSDKQLGFSRRRADREEQGVLLRQPGLGPQEHAGRATRPTARRASSSATQSYVQQVIDIAKNKYGYDPGGLGEFSKPNNSNKFFGRVDFNLGANNQLTSARTTSTRWPTSAAPQSHQLHDAEQLLPHDRQDAVVGRAVEQLVRPRCSTSSASPTRASATCAAGSRATPNFPQVRVYLPDGTRRCTSAPSTRRRPTR